MRCKICSTENVATNKYCIHCGNELNGPGKDVVTKKCSVCGTENDPENKFCIHCNNPFIKEKGHTKSKYLCVLAPIAALLLMAVYFFWIEPGQDKQHILDGGRWYFVSGDGPFQNLQFEILFNEDGTCQVNTPQMNNIKIKCSFIPIKKIKFNINGIEETAQYECNGKTLKLIFSNGSNLYQSTKVIYPATGQQQQPSNFPSKTPSPQPTSTIDPKPYSKDGVDMIKIPAGEFQMGAIAGDASADPDEKPRHPVYLDAFWIDKYEVTNRQFMNCVNAGACSYQVPQWINPSTGSSHWGPDWPDYPAIYVNWENANNYCRWAGKRLPTEAEWEKAARGTHTNYLYPWGNDLPDPPRANFARYFGNTREVGTMPGGNSFWGVHDLAGNVWEWVSDWYSKSYPAGLQNNPTGSSSGKTHVLRGGSWFSPLHDIRITVRSTPQSISQEVLGSGNWGFRCVMDVN